MAKYDGYHTALAEPQPIIERADIAIGRHGIALKYDLMTLNPPAEFRSCDVIYADLPWRSGFEEFEARAGVTGRTYVEFLMAAAWHVRELKIPTVFVTGKHALSRLSPDRSYETKLNGASALAMCWGVELADTKTERHILAELMARFDVIGDYCCGYGRTARYAVEAGKRYVVSDYNESCIARIGENMRKEIIT